jgi:hypothetical protein
MSRPIACAACAFNEKRFFVAAAARHIAYINKVKRVAEWGCCYATCGRFIALDASRQAHSQQTNVMRPAQPLNSCACARLFIAL